MGLNKINGAVLYKGVFWWVDGAPVCRKVRCVEYRPLEGAKDIWLRDFMPVRTKSGKYISFRYEPGYLADASEIRTDFRRDIAPHVSLENLVYSDVNLDGGNVVFPPHGKPPSSVTASFPRIRTFPALRSPQSSNCFWRRG